MHAVGLGIAPLIMLLGLGGGLGLPLGIPPAAEDPLLARVAPEECLFYTSWAGMAAPDPKSQNQTEQLLAEPEVQHFVAEIDRQIMAAVLQGAKQGGPPAEALAKDAAGWVKLLLTHPTALFIASAKMTPAGPDVRGGAIVAVGDEAGKLKGSLEGYQKLLALQAPPQAIQEVQIGGETWYKIALDPKAPAITWGIRGKYFVVGVGEGSVEAILARAKATPPKWLAEVRKQLPVERAATISYVNLKAILATFGPLAGLQAQTAIDAAGLGNVTALCTVTGLDKEGFVSRTLLALDGEPQGLLKLAAEKPLGAADLAMIPADATLAVAARLDADQAFETFLSLVGKIEPRALQDITGGIGEVEEALGLRLRDDVLKSLGDTWRVYNSPSEGGLVITGLTAVVSVRDTARLANVQNKLLALAKAEMDRSGDNRHGPRIEQFQFAGQTVYFFSAGEQDFPFAPAWCLTKTELIVAPTPQNVKAYLARSEKPRSVATVPALAGQLTSGGGPVALCYVDTARDFELLYPIIPLIAQVVTTQLQREGIDVNVSIVPSAPAILPHLRPSVAVLRRTKAGIEITCRQTLPGANIGSSGPVAVALLLPAVQSAREAARRAQSMNNMKQIGLALHNYHAAFNKFPPAYTTSKDGKPLLSWRVAILPYIEESDLYNQFKQDEPWDSEHNQKLIARMPSVYRNPNNVGPPAPTTYLAIRGKDTVFPGKEAIKLADIMDGSSNTIMVVEAAPGKAVSWTKPDDLQLNEKDPLDGLLGTRPGGFIALMCDGSVRFIAASIDRDTLKALFTRSDGKAVNY